MVESNILGMLSPQTKDYEYSDCIPCTAMQSTLAFVLGGYLQSPTLFREANGSVDLKKNPVVWQRLVKTVGLGLIGFGVFRLYDVYKMYDTDTEDKRQ